MILEILCFRVYIFKYRKGLRVMETGEVGMVVKGRSFPFLRGDGGVTSQLQLMEPTVIRGRYRLIF